MKRNKMKNGKYSTSQATISKGYRLKPSTHKLIKKVQLGLNTTQDRVLTLAIKLFRKENGITRKPKINK